MTFNVVATWDKTNYAPGDIMTGTISGDDVHTITTIVDETVGPVIVPVKSEDGDTWSVTLDSKTIPVPHTTTTHDSVVIDTSVPIVDNGPNPLHWVVSANKLSITATAPTA